jgi:hypothetical protein
VIRRCGAVLALMLTVGVTASPVRADDECVQQSRRLRLPGGFVEGRLSFVGIIASGRTQVGAEFSGAGLRELRIVSAWTDLEEDHQQRVEVFSPDGALYQRFTGAFTATGRPLSVTTRLPVEGTSIVDAGLYGAWCVELYLDDEDEPIARRRFTLTAP